MDQNDIINKDKQYNWHAYTQHKTATDPVPVVKGKDALLWDANGKEYIDAISSWWANPYGHCNDFINSKIKEQLDTLEHVLFGGFTHPWASELSEKLCASTQDHLSKVFYSDNGSTAVEVALKMCMQYYNNQGKKKNIFIAFEDAFHGDTFGAMATSGIGLFTQAFKDDLLEVKRLPLPQNKESFEQCKKLLSSYLKEDDIAAFIFEPLVLGAAGMQMYSATYLDELIGIAQKNNTICIADEVMTGFGRTGTFWAIDQLQNKPDILCTAKGLTAGYLPMAATLATEKIYQAFLSTDSNKALFHGHTFMANPIGCATALASFELYHSDQMKSNRERVLKQQQKWIEHIKNNPKIKYAEQKGMIAVIEIESTDKEIYGSLRNTLYNFYIEQGMILRPLGNRVYVLPPFSITDSQLKKVYDTIEKSLELC